MHISGMGGIETWIDALEFILHCANLNGFNTITTEFQIIIGDGLRGTDDIIVPVPNGEYIKEAYIGRAIMDADVFISLTHFKGHEEAGFGGKGRRDFYGLRHRTLVL